LVPFSRQQAEDALIEPRSAARFAESELEVVLREIAVFQRGALVGDAAGVFAHERSSLAMA
jgi:hypothetical protein